MTQTTRPPPVRTTPRTTPRSTPPFWAAERPTLLLGAFVFTEVAFMVWVLIGVLGVHIARDLALTAGQIGLLAAVPILAGTLGRLPAGILADRFGPRRVGIGVLAVVALALLSVWSGLSTGYHALFFSAMGLGAAGVALSIAMPLVSHRYPPEHQGVALGLTAVGGVGTVITAVFAPRLAEAYGWQPLFGLFVPPVLLAMGLFWMVSQEEIDRPATPRPWNHYLQAIRYGDSLWFSLFYAITFGGFISLTASLVLYFHHQFQMAPTLAGEMTALCIVGGALFRPIGGWMADRFGGIRTLQIAFVLVTLAMLLLAMGDESPPIALLTLFVAMSGLGAGNGAIFQLIPLRFPRRMGVVTGLVGSAGGLGGFALVWGFGVLQEWHGGYTGGFVVLAALSGVALGGLWSVKRRWRTTWGAPFRTRGRV